MKWLNLVRARLRGLLRREAVLQDIDEELRSHVEMETHANIGRGMTPDEARLAALRSFGDLGRARELVYEVRGGGMLEMLWQDLRYGARMLVKQPGFTSIAVLTLGLGIGANTAIFSVVNAVLLRPLPFEQPDRLVMVWQTNMQTGSLQDPASFLNLVDWQQQNQVFEQIAAFMPRGISLTDIDEPEQLPGSFVSANLFPALGVTPTLGRTFLPDEDRPGGGRDVILSHGLWQRRFGGDPDIIGKALTLNGASHTVVGVMPADFQFPIPGQFPIPPTQLWVPLAIDPGQENRGDRSLFAVGRLKSGVTAGQAQAEMTLIARRLEQQYPDANTGSGVKVVPLHEQVVGRLRPALLVLLGAVGFVLLIACANVASLLLSRAAARQKEIAIRAALGAGRLRLVRQLLTETVLLTLMGGTLVLLLAYVGMDSLKAGLPPNLPRADEISIDRQVLGFSFVVSLFTGLVFGLVPAWQASRPDLNEVLKEGGGKGAGGQGRSRARNVLTVAEVAAAFVLLVGAGLLIKSFYRLQQVNLGFNPERALSVPLALTTVRYRDGGARLAFVEQVAQRLKGLPGVQAVGGVTTLPLSSNYSTGTFAVEGRPPDPGESNIANVRAATPDYFRAMEIPLIGGRAFTEEDTFQAPAVTVINETLARRYWPGENPIGKRIISPARADGTLTTVVGMVGDVRNDGLDDEPKPELYFPYAQNRQTHLAIVVRTANYPAGLMAAVRREVWAVDKNLPLANLSTLEQLLDKTIAQRRFNLLLLGMFAGVALVLAAVGIYGVMSYAVTQRTHEIGVRMALGAQTSNVLRMVVGQGIRLALVGIAIGLGAALALTRLMASLLYEVSATDPLTFAVIALMLAAVALVACYVPARRATRVDPMLALRYE